MAHYYSTNCSCSTCSTTVSSQIYYATTNTSAATDWYDTVTTSWKIQDLKQYLVQFMPVTKNTPKRKQVAEPPTYRQPPREFNRYINGSDLMEEFIAFLGENSVRQREVMRLPIELFIKWLIVRACEQDGEEASVQVVIPTPKKQPRCLGCGKWIRADSVVALHDEACSTKYFSKIKGQTRIV